MLLKRFERYVPRTAKLIGYGFIERGGELVYEKQMLDGQFTFSMTVGEGGRLSERVIDNFTLEDYVLHRGEGSVGTFVGSVRAEVEKILDDILSCCFERDVFKEKLTRELIDRTRRSFGEKLEFLWEKYPEFAVFRHFKSKKWYMVVMRIPQRKLGIDKDGTIEVVNLNVGLGKAADHVDRVRFFPAYHMTKKNWVTARIDAFSSVDELFGYVEASRELAGKQKNKRG